MPFDMPASWAAPLLEAESTLDKHNRNPLREHGDVVFSN